MADLALFGVLALPALAAVALGLLPGYHLQARLNVLAAFLSFLSALVFLVGRPAPGPYILVDDFNVYLIVSAVAVFAVGLISFLDLLGVKLAA